MKLFVAIVMAIGSASALGSGPYLPSGWRPQGAAFFLPGEVKKPADNPLKETLLFETEASGSDSLREYGPPKTSDNVISQGLPDVETEQIFQIAEYKGAVVEETVVSADVDLKSELILEATTEAQITEEKITEVYQRIADIEIQSDVTTATYGEEVTSEEIVATFAALEEQVAEEKKQEEVLAEKRIQEEVVEEKRNEIVVGEKLQQVLEEKLEQVEEKAIEEAVQEKLEQVVVEQVEAFQEGVKTIADALVNLKSDIKAEQVKSAVAAEVNINQEGFGSSQVPEGFLEYGPPGFREYGPPKGDELLRTAAILQEPSNSVALENNDLRRRRFSPKFRVTKIKKIQ